MQPDVIQRHSGPAPRYTSYPTAPNFTPAVTTDAYKTWLRQLPRGARLSLYLHIPFCRELCWYCACNTRAVRRYAPVESYLESLAAEIGLVAALIPSDAEVTHIHWGGGSPSMLSPFDIGRLARALRGHSAILQALRCLLGAGFGHPRARRVTAR